MSTLAAFAGVSFVLIVVPGPSVLFVVSRAVALGRRAALLTVVGNAMGVYCQMLLVAVGLGAIVERSIVAFTAIKLAGAAYLIWLGMHAIRDRRSFSATASTKTITATASAVKRRSTVLDGFVVGIANPKAIVFFAAILPQYVAVGGAPAPLQMAVLGLVFVSVALLSDGAWGLLAGSARDWLVRSPRRAEGLSAAGGVAMIGLGVRLAASGRPDR